MLILTSPSKTQKMGAFPLKSYSQPQFIKKSQEIIEILRQFDSAKLKELLKTSDTLTIETEAKIRAFTPATTAENATAALFLFQGDAYAAIQAGQYSHRQLDYAQEHLGILSGLYGLLRPLDLIQPYRLEAATKLRVGKAANLYAFWREVITAEIVERTTANKAAVINLASLEYSKMVTKKDLNAPFITPVFRQYHPPSKSYKTIAIHAKRARGKMIDFIIREGLKEALELKSFTRDGYRYLEEVSDESSWIFVKD